MYFVFLHVSTLFWKVHNFLVLFLVFHLDGCQIRKPLSSDRVNSLVHNSQFQWLITLFKFADSKKKDGAEIIWGIMDCTFNNGSVFKYQ
jgi:hypothetical protein